MSKSVDKRTLVIHDTVLNTVTTSPVNTNENEESVSFDYNQCRIDIEPGKKEKLHIDKGITYIKRGTTYKLSVMLKKTNAAIEIPNGGQWQSENEEITIASNSFTVKKDATINTTVIIKYVVNGKPVINRNLIIE